MLGYILLRITLSTLNSYCLVLSVYCYLDTIQVHNHIQFCPLPSPQGYGEGKPKSSTRAQEVNALKGVYILMNASGFAHTLMVARVDTEEDKQQVEQLPVFVPDVTDSESDWSLDELRVVLTDWLATASSDVNPHTINIETPGYIVTEHHAQQPEANN